MINVYNENRLTRSLFFKNLIEYLYVHADVTLREIHERFSNVHNIDRQLEKFITNGLILRQHKRYFIGLQVFTDEEFTCSLQQSEGKEQKTEILNLSETSLSINSYNRPFFVDAKSKISQLLDKSFVYLVLSNATNAIKIHETSTYDRRTATLSNYFYKVAERLPLSVEEQEVYNIMGDVDPEYALKYMTTFLLRFREKDTIKAHPDIFVRVLEKYEYIKKINEQEYNCLLRFDEKKKIEIIPFDNAKDFIIEQIKQKILFENYISLM